MTAIIVIILVLAVTVFVIKNLMAEGIRSRHSSSAVHKDEAQKVKNQHKPNKETRDKQNRFSTTSKPKAKKSNVIGETATALAGAALAHQMIKHHKHDDARDIADDFRDPYDVDIDDMDDLYDLDIENDSYDDSDYDSYRAAYEEEQAAYDDFIASLDMDDN